MILPRNLQICDHHMAHGIRDILLMRTDKETKNCAFLKWQSTNEIIKMKILKYFFSKTIHHFWFAPLAHARQISLKYPHSPNFMKKIKNQTREKVVFQKKLYMIIFLKKFIPSNRSEQNILVISVVQLKKIEIALNSMNFLEIHCYDPMRPPVFGYFILQ